MFGAERVQWNSDRSLSDFDLVVARPHFGEFAHDPKIPGQRQLAQFNALVAYRHWGAEVAPFLRSGKTLIVLLGKPEAFRFDEVQNAPQMIWAWDLLSLPLTDVKTLSVKKPRLTKAGERFFGEHSELLSRFQIGTSFKIPGARPLITTDDDTDRWLACEFEFETGRVIVIPQTLYWDRAASTTANTSLKNEIQTEENLLGRFALASKLTRPKSEPPEWSKAVSWRSAKEQALNDQLEAVASQVRSLQEEQSKLTEEASEISQMRALLYSNGAELEHAVRRALRDLGLNAEPFDDGKLRIDARFEHNGIVYVCEIEGKDNKAVDISKYRQLMDMCLGELQRLGDGADVRGILIGNGYRTKAPADRAVQFTDQVLSSAVNQGVLVVSTTDLYRAWIDAADGRPNNASTKLTTAILSRQAGLFQG